MSQVLPFWKTVLKYTAWISYVDLNQNLTEIMGRVYIHTLRCKPKNAKKMETLNLVCTLISSLTYDQGVGMETSIVDDKFILTIITPEKYGELIRAGLNFIFSMSSDPSVFESSGRYKDVDDSFSEEVPAPVEHQPQDDDPSPVEEVD